MGSTSRPLESACERPGRSRRIRSGLVAATVYSLWMIQQSSHGAPRGDAVKPADLTAREAVPLLAMIAALVWLGLFPQPVFDLGHSALKGIEAVVTQGGGP